MLASDYSKSKALGMQMGIMFFFGGSGGGVHPRSDRNGTLERVLTQNMAVFVTRR